MGKGKYSSQQWLTKALICLNYLTLKVPITTAADNFRIFIIFIFQRK